MGEDLPLGHAEFTPFEEETNEIVEFKNAIEMAIENCAKGQGLDRAYYKFTVFCDELNGSFEKRRAHVLIDEHDGFCAFCSEKTEYYDHDLHMYLCASCYGRARGRQ